MQGYIEKSFAIEADDLQKINTFTRSEFDEGMLYAFTLTLCNNDIDRDYEKFSVEALHQLCELFVGKTGICDHALKASDQKARIFDAWVEVDDGVITADGEKLYQLKAKAYMVKTEENMPLITEIEAGIKKEVSVSCSASRNICSICGNDKRSGSCSHRNGRVYDGKTAYSVLSDIQDAYEFSFVAVPAQRDAGVTKAFDFEKGDISMEKIIDTLKSCDSQVVLSKLQARELCDYVEQLDEDAKLGKEYKKSLADEVVSLCAKVMPDMDIEVFSGVAQVMTTNELLSFKKAFLKAKKPVGATVQLTPAEHSTITNNNFKI